MNNSTRSKTTAYRSQRIKIQRVTEKKEKEKGDTIEYRERSASIHRIYVSL